MDYVEFSFLCGVEHVAQAFEAADVCNLVRVGDYRRRAARDDYSAELFGAYVRGFNMDMPVDETWREKFSARVKNFFAVVFFLAHADNFSVINRYFARINFAAQHVDDLAIFYNEVGLSSAGRRVDKIFQLNFCH